MGACFSMSARCGRTASSLLPNLIVSARFLKEHPDLVKNWLRAHVELTDWINANIPEAKKTLNAQIQKETGKALPDAVLDEAFGRLQVTTIRYAVRCLLCRKVGIRCRLSRQAGARSYRAFTTCRC